jgi:FtsZ-interacting cell division protein YlmF
MKIINIIQAMSLSVFLTASCTTADTPSTENDTTTTEISNTPVAALPTLNELEKDPDVIWMGDVEVDYALNYSRWDYDATAPERVLMEKLGFKSRNSFKVLKYQVNDFNTSNNDDHNLFYKILDNRNEMKLYKESTLETVCTPKEVEHEIGRVDTVVTFDPKTFDEIVQVVVSALNPEDVKGFRVRQVIYYSKKAMAFKSIALSVAPLLYTKSYEAGVEPSPADLMPLFWMKATALNTVPSLASQDINWAKRMYRNFDLSTVKMIKQEQSIDVIIEQMMADFRANPETTKLSHTFDADGTQYLVAEEVKSLGASIDTIITFDPKTFKEIIQVVTSNFEGKAIENLRLIQDWVWDEKTNSLSIRYVGFAPIINRVDDNGNFLNSGPMFIRKVEDIQ